MKLYIIKIGGNIIDKEEDLNTFLKKFAAIEGKKILVHGGGKMATKIAEALNIPQKMLDGRRITDAETLKLVTMVYAGLINKTIVSLLQKFECNAIGLSGADGNAIQAKKREKGNIDYGFAGDIEKINTGLLKDLIEKGLVPVLAPITHNRDGQLLNTNADTIAGETAITLSEYFDVSLIYGFEKAGVLKDAADENSVISKLNPVLYSQYKNEKIITEGLIPKLDNAFSALEKGVKKVIIGKALEPEDLIEGRTGTTISTE